MPLYLVRWPDFRISLVHARDKSELSHTLDEVGDPGPCRVKVYKGPLHLSFKLNLDFEDQTNYRLTPLKPKAKIKHSKDFHVDGAAFELTDPNLSDTHTEMWEEFVKFCFPKFYQLGCHLPGEGDDASPEAHSKALADIKSAALEELREFFKCQQAYKQNNEDSDRYHSGGNN